MISGSLPRPRAVLDHLTDHPDLEIPASVLEKAVQETVARQVKAGISLVGDGEMSKPSYVSYVTSRLEGFGGSDRGPGVADLAEFPEFAKQQVGRQFVREREGRGEKFSHFFLYLQIEIGAVIPRDSEYIKCCTGPIKYRDFQAVEQDLRILQNVKIF